MSKEQTIIDGVDVNGCTYYDANADKESAFLFDCKREHAPCWSCASMPGCLYKKYKRKEQECEELKEQNKKLKHSFKELNVYIEKAQKWLKKQKLNDIFIDEMRAVLLEELKCLKKI